MLTSLEIQNFKAFRHLKIERLAKVNLFVGEGNSGKTSVLEALHLIPHTSSTELPQFRALASNDKFSSWMFHDNNTANEVHVIGRTAEGKVESWITSRASRPGEYVVGRLTDKADLLWSAASKHRWLKLSSVITSRQGISELARLYDSWTDREGYEERFEEFARTVDSRINYLRVKEHTGVRMLYASIGLPELIPLPLLGEGLNRLIEIYGAIIGEGANIVLIDEIENGLHWKALPKVWQGIKAVVDVEDVQIFATTHSIECIQAASEVFKGPPDDFAVHRLERRDDGEIHCITMDEETLGRMLERGWEVR